MPTYRQGKTSGLEHADRSIRMTGDAVIVKATAIKLLMEGWNIEFVKLNMTEASLKASQKI